MSSTRNGILLSLCALSLSVGGMTALSGCAAGRAPRATQPLPESPQQGRQEIDGLLQHIERLRRQLGLPVRAGEAAVSLNRESDRTPGAPSKAAPESPPPPSPSPTTLRSTRVEQPADSERVEVTADDAESERCRYTKAICHAAERICRIADYLADDDAQARCQRARADCREARLVSGC